MTPHRLVTKFEKARLPLEVRERPLFPGRGMDAIVQLDVVRPDRRVRHERFAVFTGAPTNRVEVEQVDPSLRQLVLLVHEPRRRFETFVGTWQSQARPPNAVRVAKNGWFVENFTESRKRHFLVGMDEQHLFIAQLPRPTSTVWGAHQVLKGDEVRNAERGAFERTVRQGEWFFISLLPREEAEVEREAARAPLRVRRHVGIAEAAGWSRGGRPHLADEVLLVGSRAYVRGRVRHPDHATLELQAWRRVLANTEAFERPAGVGFVD
jgi:hypothetical protein